MAKFSKMEETHILISDAVYNDMINDPSAKLYAQANRLEDFHLWSCPVIDKKAYLVLEHKVEGGEIGFDDHKTKFFLTYMAVEDSKTARILEPRRMPFFQSISKRVWKHFNFDIHSKPNATNTSTTKCPCCGVRYTTLYCTNPNCAEGKP